MKKYSLTHYMYIMFFVLLYGSAMAERGPVGDVGDYRIINTVGADYVAWWQVENNTPFEISAEFGMSAGNLNARGTISKIIFNKLAPWGISSPIMGGYNWDTTNRWYFFSLTSFIDRYTHDGPYGQNTAVECDVTADDKDASFDQPIRVIIDSPNVLRVVMKSKTCNFTLPNRAD